MPPPITTTSADSGILWLLGMVWTKGDMVAKVSGKVGPVRASLIDLAGILMRTRQTSIGGKMVGLKRRTVLAGAVGLSGLPGFAATTQAQGTPRRGGTLRISVDQAASVIHPLRTRVNPEHMVAELCYANLTTLTTEMAPLPDLALSWSANADFTEWTFKLRPGVKFSDGSPCTAKDVAATYLAILDPKTASPARSIISMIKEPVAVDDETVLFRLNTAYPDLPATVAVFGTRIIFASIATGDLAKDRKSTRLNSSHTEIYTLSLHDALPIYGAVPPEHGLSRPAGDRGGVRHADHLRFHRHRRPRQRSEEHTSELQSHRDLHSFPTRRSSDLRCCSA